jgi:hypothetical protein
MQPVFLNSETSRNIHWQMAKKAVGTFLPIFKTNVLDYEVKY